MIDITDIMERIDEGKCLICKKELGEINSESVKELRKVTYNGKQAFICRKHHYVETI